MIMKTTLLFLTILGLAVCHPLQDALSDPNWKAWKHFHGKVYKNGEDERIRNFVWQDNLKKIVRHNDEGHGYELAMNHLGDMTEEEIKTVLNGFKDVKSKNLLESKAQDKGSVFLRPSNIQEPDSVDWRKEGYVTPVKNQGHCGSCWSFSTTGALEGQHFRKTGKLVSLSEQNLVDCSSKYGNGGCLGGLMDNAFRYIKDNGGVDTEKSYPYHASVGKCHFNASNIGATDTSFVDIPRQDEQALKAALASVGPVSVAIDASHSSFHFYHKGVYDDVACSSTQLDHAVLAVGYGTEDGKDFWLIKNSWGTTWGDEGYVKIARKNNLCGVATKASYPLV